MAKRVFKVTCIKGFGPKLLEGMTFEVVSGFSKPTTPEMKKAFKEKYGHDLPTTSSSYFQIS